MDNVIAEESAEGGHKVRVGEEEEAVNEAMCGGVVEGSADGGHKVQLGEEESLKETVGNAIVEESTDGESKVQVRDEETLNETTGSAIVEEISDGERMERASEEEALNEATGNVIVDGSTDAEPKAQVREEEALNEATGDIIIGEGTDGERKAQVGEEEVLMETLGNDIVKESTDGENQAQVRVEGAMIETMDYVIVAESNDGEHKAVVREEEALNGTMGNDVVDESNDAEHRGQVREEEALNETMGNAIVEESTDGDHKAQVAEADGMTETMDNVIIEESTGVEHKAQVREVNALTETMGNVLVEESSDVERKTQVGEAEALTETIGDVVMEESRDVEHKTRVLEAEALTETTGDVILEASTAGRHKAQVGEAEALTETIGNVIIKESTAGEHKAQLREEEVSNKTVKQAMQSMASGTRIIPPMENDQHVSYHLPSLDKANFSISDLVWGKVKSHPWWPGQIFDPSDASKLAMKYHKKDSFLISYYGDKTFAWCDESQLKPFHSYFSQLEKQCSSDTFIKAIHDILMEVSRRVELGMTCSCLPEEDYTKIKYQKVENAGIRGGNINSIIDRSTVANYFEPEKLLEYVKTLAQFPNGRVDKLEFVIARSQLKAFYHSKGYPELPIFTVGGGLLESVPENLPSSGKGSTEDFVEQCTPVLSDLISLKKTLKSEESSFNKREHGVVKQKNTSKLTEDGKTVHLANGGKGKSVPKAAEKSISSFSGKKHIIVESDPTDSGRCKKRILDSFEDIEFKSPSPTVTSSFRIGEFIRRAASQLTGGPPILKCQGETLQKDGPQADHKIDYVADFDVPPDSPVENLRTNLSFTEDYNSPDVLLSQLCLAARDPMEEYSFVSAVVDFFTGFRNFCMSSSSEDKEHLEKRRRGRPRKVISQQAVSDIITSEDEKRVGKRKRGMNMISQLAYSDISSENEKPVEKRKRGRPRKYPLLASSDSEDVKPLQKPRRGRPRGRPRKVDSRLASHNYSSFESKKLVETRKRGRPRKVSSDIVPADMTTPDRMKDSYWSDDDLQKKRNGKSLVQYQKRRRRKSTGEQSLCQLTPTLEQQLQLAMNPDMKLTFVAERSVISVEEKIVDECMPTALILIFNNANSLPSETHLIRIFSRYGPLKEAETEVLWKTNRAKVVFKRRVDAETAFSSAGKYSIFGPGLLSYQLKPWSPKSSLLAMPLGTQEAARTEMAEDTHDVAHIVSPANTRDTAPITMPEDNLVAAFIPTPEDKLDLAPVITSQDYCDLAPIPMVQHSHGTAQDKCTSVGISGGNLELSVHAETVIASDGIQVEAEGRESSGKHDPEPISTSHENQDSVVVASLLDEHNLTPTTAKDNLDAAAITMVQDNPNAAVIITLQNKCEAEPSVGSSTELSEQAEDVIVLNTIQVEPEGKESSPHDKHGPGLIAALEEKQDAVPIASPLNQHDLTPTSTKGKLDAAPNTMVEDSRDVAAVITPQDKCNAGQTIGSNLELSVQAEDVIASDTIQMEIEGEKSSPHDKHEPALIATPLDNQDVVPVASPQDEDDSTPITTQDNLDGASITMVEDNLVATHVLTRQHKYDAEPVVGSNLEFSEQVEAVVASDATQVEADGKESLPRYGQDPLLMTVPEQNQIAEHCTSLLDQHDSTPTTTHDNLDAAQISLPHDNHDATSFDASQDNQHTESIASLPSDDHDAAPIAKPQENHDSVSIATPPDHPDATSITTSQDNHDAGSISNPGDEHDLAPITTEQDCHDLAPITTVQDNQDAAPTITLQEKLDIEPTVGSNLELSEQVEDAVASNTIQVEAEGKESLPQDKHNPALSTTTQKNQDAEPISALLDKHDSTPPIAQADLDAASICTPQDIQDAEPTASLPQDYHGAAPITIPQDNHAAVSIASPPDHSDVITPITASQDDQDAAPIATAQDRHDLGPIIPTQDSHDFAPVTTVEVKHDAADVVALQDKHDAGRSVGIGSNLELSEQAGVIASDTIQVEAEGKESPTQDIHDPAQIATPQQNQDTIPAASLLDRHDSIPATTQDNLDAASIAMVPDNHDVAPVTTPHDKYNAALTEGCNIQVSEQAESGVCSETNAEGEGCNLEVSERTETGMASDAMQI